MPPFLPGKFPARRVLLSHLRRECRCRSSERRGPLDGPVLGYRISVSRMLLQCWEHLIRGSTECHIRPAEFTHAHAPRART
jgi:hypothetical protein